MGIAVITESADLDAAAEALADDVIAFDQRGCLSPRIAFVAASSAFAFGEKLHAALTAREQRIPRGELSSSERADAQRYADTLRFAGTLYEGSIVAIGLDDPNHSIVPRLPQHARTSALGRMQRPRLDGPVDRRSSAGT
jgi:hypothetical protein